MTPDPKIEFWSRGYEAAVSEALKIAGKALT